MSGTIGAREDRQVIPQAVGTADLSRDFSLAGSLAARQGEQIAGVLTQAGTLAANAGRAEAARAAEETANAEPLLRGPDGKLTPPDLSQRFWLSVGEQRRREILLARYGQEFVSDNTATFLSLRQRAAGNPDSFLEMARAHRDGTLEALPPALRGVVRAGFDQEMRRHHQSLQAERIQRDFEAGRQQAALSLANTARDLGNALASGSYVDRIVQYESGGDLNAAATTSSARGAGQFINGTWLAFARANPALFEGLSQDQILARRSDLALSRQAIVWYAEKNAAALRAAGVAPTEAALALSHQFDGPVAARMLKADPATPVEQIVGAGAVAANRRQLEGKTVGEVVGTFRRRFGDAPPPDGEVQALGGRVRANLQDQVRLGYMTPAAAADEERKLLTVLPMVQRLHSEAARGDIASARAMVTALATGPTAEGWRPEWNTLRPDEARALAREVSQIVGYRWEHVTWQRGEQDRALDTDLASTSSRIGALEGRAMRAAAGTGEAPLTLTERAELQELYTKRTDLLVQRRSTAAGEAAQAPSRFLNTESQLRSQQLGSQMTLERAEQLFGRDPEFQRLQERIMSLRVEDRASIVTSFVEQRRGEMQATARAAAADAALLSSLNGGGPSVPNEDQYRQAAGRELARRLGPDGSPQQFVRHAVEVSRGGAAPPQMMTLIERGLAGGRIEDVHEAGRLVRALQQDPRASNTLAGIEPSRRNALVRAADMLDSGGNADTALQQFRADLRQQVGPLDAALARLGSSPQERETKINEMVERMARHFQSEGTPGLLTRFGAAAAFVAAPGQETLDDLRRVTRTEDVYVPPQMLQLIRDRLLAALPHYADLSTWTLDPFATNPLEAALRREVGNALHEWGQSGIASMPGAPANRFQWVQGAPESRYAVPDASGRPSVEWVQPFVHEELRRQKIEKVGDTPIGDLRFGVNLSLVPIGRDARGEWEYQLHSRVHGTWFAVGRPLPNRQEGLDPMTISLADRATQLRNERNQARRAEEAANFGRPSFADDAASTLERIGADVSRMLDAFGGGRR